MPTLGLFRDDNLGVFSVVLAAIREFGSFQDISLIQANFCGNHRQHITMG